MQKHLQNLEQCLCFLTSNVSGPLCTPCIKETISQASTVTFNTAPFLTTRSSPFCKQKFILATVPNWVHVVNWQEAKMIQFSRNVTLYLWRYAILKRTRKSCALKNCYVTTRINRWEPFLGNRASVLPWNPLFYGNRIWISNCYRVGHQRAVMAVVRAMLPGASFLDDFRGSGCGGVCSAAT